MQFDHLMHWVPDLDDAVARCQQLGFPVQVGGRLGNGMHNAMCRNRDLTAIELIGVYDWDAWRSGPAGSGRVARENALLHGGALQCIFEVDDLEATVAEVRSRGISVSDPAVASFERAEGGTYTWRTARITEGPGWRPFFIQYPTPRAERLAQAHKTGRSFGDWSFERIYLTTPDPDAAADWLARVLGVRSQLADGWPELSASGCNIRVVEGATDRITRISLRGPDAPFGMLAAVFYDDGRPTDVSPQFGPPPTAPNG